MANVIDKVAGLVVGPQGPQGPQGPKGDTGQTGPQGATGATGATPNFTIGTVTTLDPDDDATATITGTAANPVLNLGIPKGDTGEVSQAEFDEVAEDVSQLKSEITDIDSNVDSIYFNVTIAEDEWETSGAYHYWNVRMTVGNTYVIVNTGNRQAPIYLRAEKTVTPSLVTIDLAVNMPYYYTPEVDTNWIVFGGDNPIGLNVKNITAPVQHILDTYISIEDFVQNTGYYKYDDFALTWDNGNYAVNVNGIVSSTTRCYAKLVVISGGNVHLEIPPNMKGRMNFTNSSGNVIPTSSSASWTSGAFNYAVPNGAVKVGISVAFKNDTTITPSDCDTLSAYCFDGTIINASAFVGKKISILGDSISTFAGYSAESASDGHLIADGIYTYTGNHCRYPNSYLTNVNDTYWTQLINAFDMRLGINDSWAGSCVSWSGSEGDDSGADIYIASPTRINHLGDNGYPDIILVNAGTNDIGKDVQVGTFNTESPVDYTDSQIANLNVSTFADAYRALLIRLQKAYPLARIVVMLPNYTTSYYDPTKADSYLEVIKEACDYFGVPWIDMRMTGITMFNTGTYLGDGIHPNVSGMNLLAKKVEKFFAYSL